MTAPQLRETDRKTALIACIFGAVGAVFLLFGDMLFYGVWGSSGDFSVLSTMARRAPETLIIGAVLGPVGGIFYALGMGYFYLTLRGVNYRLAIISSGSLAIVGLLIGAYHLAYAFLGFSQMLSERADQTFLLTHVRDLLGSLNLALYITGLPATVAIVAMAVRRSSAMPVGLVLLLPTLTPLIATIAPQFLLGLPSPWGGVVRGSWDNGCFLMFFGAAIVHLLTTRSRDQKNASGVIRA